MPVYAGCSTTGSSDAVAVRQWRDRAVNLLVVADVHGRERGSRPDAVRPSPVLRSEAGLTFSTACIERDWRVGLLREA